MKEKILKRLNEIQILGQEAKATSRYHQGIGHIVDIGKKNGFKAAGLSFIEKIFGKNHSYYSSYDLSIADSYTANIDSGIEILKTIKQEIEGDWLFTLKDLISAEIFSDFLEMALYLIEQKYKDPAAVLIGTILEENLRKLCEKNSIETTFEKEGKLIFKKADRLNSELASKNSYTKLNQKAITMWLDLRNKAAHGNYAEYSIDQVSLMYSGVLDFIRRSQI